MSRPEPVLEVIASVIEAAPEPAVDTAAGLAEDDPADVHDIAWLHRIVELSENRLTAVLPTPSVDALLGQGASPGAPSDGPRLVAVDRLNAGGNTVRQRVDPAATAELAASIAAQGLLQPLLVRRSGDDFEIVAGARRCEAARLAGLSALPVIVLDLSDREALMASVVENLQRQDLAPLDEAEAYLRLVEEFGWTQDELARHVGRSRSHIANTLRLNGLPASVKAMLDDGRLTAGHARALLNADDPEALAERVVARGLTVRATEAAARPKAPAAVPAHDANTARLEKELGTRLGLRVHLQSSRKGGKMTIYYRSPDELDAALRAYGQAAAQPAQQDTPAP